MKVNGEEILLREPCSLSEFLQSHGYRQDKIAVEKNGEIIPKANYELVLLQENDTLEVVSFVGGG